jgi:hypothetical protein
MNAEFDESLTTKSAASSPFCALLRLLVATLFLFVNLQFAFGNSPYPSWWTNRNVIATNASSTNDYAAAAAGQVKWIATNAYTELNANLPNGAGTGILGIITNFTLTNNYYGVNVGQVKNVAKPFWDRLIQEGYTNAYPWTATTTDDCDNAMATIGQLKYVFSFDLIRDTDMDGLPDWWEVRYFGNLSQNGTGDSDGDGLNNFQEYQYGTDPQKADTDGDGLTDRFEIYYSTSVVCWGDNASGQTNVPSSLSNVLGVAAGGYHSMALKSNGTVVCWGATNRNFNYGQTNMPPSLSNVMAIAAGYGHSMALKSNGTVVCWGATNSVANYGQTNVPASLSNVVAISAGGYHSMALKSDGTVVCWGATNRSVSSGQTNVPPSLSNVVAIAAGAYHSMALKSDGKVVCWGATNSVANYGQTNVPASLSNVVAIGSGDLHGMAVARMGLYLNPLAADTDGDGLSDSMEINVSHTSPTIPDTDGDGMPDGYEYYNGLNPLDSNDVSLDPDHDGLTNLQECQYGTIPLCADTDNDGLLDGQEVSFGSNPNLPDTDGDGFTDLEEYIYGSDPNNPNSQCGISGTISYSGRQVGSIYVSATNAFSNLPHVSVLSSPGNYTMANVPTLSTYWIAAFCDSNGNGTNDFWEAFGKYPTNPLTLNAATNGINIILQDPDTDGDGLPDWWEMQNFTNLSQTATNDFDHDGVSNSNEYRYGTSPTNAASTLRSISGTVSYTGAQTGRIVIAANTQPGLWSSVFTTNVSAPGSFVMTNVATLANYWVEAYRDSNGSGSNDAWEASCFATNSIYLTNNISGRAIVLTDPDTDGDGLPDWWERQIIDANTYDNITTVQDVLPGDDFDHDGVSNSNEYSRGTSPTNAASLPSVLGFVGSTATVAETNTNTTVSISIRLYPPAGSVVTARVYVVNSSATTNDYKFGANNTTNITFLAGQTNKSVSVSILSQAMAEPDESVTFGLDLVSGPAIVGNDNGYALMIQDYTDGTGFEPAPGWTPDTGDSLKLRLLTPSNGAQ